MFKQLQALTRRRSAAALSCRLMGAKPDHQLTEMFWVATCCMSPLHSFAVPAHDKGLNSPLDAPGMQLILRHVAYERPRMLLCRPQTSAPWQFMQGRIAPLDALGNDAHPVGGPQPCCAGPIQQPLECVAGHLPLDCCRAAADLEMHVLWEACARWLPRA